MIRGVSSKRVWDATRRLTTLVAFVVLGMIVARPVGAQVSLEGHVVDDLSDLPLSHVRLVVQAEDGNPLDTAVTDEQGYFRFELDRNRSVRLAASRAGYRDAISPVLRTDDHAHLGLEFRLHPDVVLLAPLAVVVRSPREANPVLGDFYARLEGDAPGVYLTEEDIRQRSTSSLSDLVATVPGIRVQRSGRGVGRAHVSTARSISGLAGSSCPVQIFLDGTLANRVGALALDELVSPHQVTGIEIHRGLSSVPAEFLNEYSRCGVIAIWTKRHQP